MSTFGRGVRLELKRITGNAGSVANLVSVSDSSNFFVFINKIQSVNSAVISVLRDTLNVSSGGITTASQIFAVDNAEPFIDYLSGIQDETVSSSALSEMSNNFCSRIVAPGETLRASGGGVNSYYAIWYTEVYFGGQANY